MTEPRGQFHFVPADFDGGASDPLKPRWDDTVRQEIRRLTPAKAREVAGILMDYVSQRGYMLSERYFSTIAMMPTDGDVAAVEPWLRVHAPDPNQEVLVAYARTNYVYLVTSDIFCAHWDDFCYPSSDDVVICPPTEEWVLFFYHEEVFFWGKPQRKAVGRSLGTE